MTTRSSSSAAESPAAAPAGRGRLAVPGLAVIIAGALFTGVVPGSPSNDTQTVGEPTLPPPPPVVAFVEESVVVPDDGIERVVVRPLETALTEPTLPADATSRPPT